MICLWFWFESFLCFTFEFIVIRIIRLILRSTTSSDSNRIVFIRFILKLVTNLIRWYFICFGYLLTFIF